MLTKFVFDIVEKFDFEPEPDPRISDPLPKKSLLGSDTLNLRPLPGHRGAQAQPHQPEPRTKVRIVLQGCQQLTHLG